MDSVDSIRISTTLFRRFFDVASTKNIDVISTTLFRRLIDVVLRVMTSWQHSNVYSTSYRRHVPTGLFVTAVVLHPDSEVVAPIELTGGPLGTCALIVPSRQLAEDFGVVVGHTLVNASTCSANVLMINPNAEEVVLPCKTCVRKLVPISAAWPGRNCNYQRMVLGHCQNTWKTL